MRFIALVLIASVAFACPDDPYCLACGKKQVDSGVAAQINDAVCLYCQYSFFNPKSGLCDRKITEAVEECEAYKLKDGKQVCARCQMGFFLNEEENKCIKCAVQNCIECNKEQICTACIGGLIPEKDESRKEKHKCGESKKPAPNCRVSHGMDLEGKCYKCEQGFALNNEQDKACVKSVDNCQIADLSEPATKCFQCSSSHFIKADGSCEKHNSLSIFWVLGIIVPVAVALLAYGIMRLFKKRETIGDNEADTYQQV